MASDYFKKLKVYSPSVVRYGVGIVFLLFGVSQMMNPQAWTVWVPNYASNILDALIIVKINSFFDFFVGLFLILGLFTRFFALLGVLHLIGIVVSVGYNDISIRDFGLLLAVLGTFLNGPDKLCLDNKFNKK